MADWLLLLDSDTLVANMSNSMDRFLNGPQHVLLTYRLNREIIAGAVAVRTTQFGECFIKRWIALIATQAELKKQRNNDNGALLLMLAEFLDPNLAKKCNEAPAFPPGDYWEFMACWEAVYAKFAAIPSDPNQPVRLYPPLGGFWRSQSMPILVHEPFKVQPCFNITEKSIILDQRCWSTDIFISGWKQMGVNMWPVVGSNDTLIKCSFNEPDNEIKFAKKCCLVEYPGCYDASGKNVCRQQPACIDARAGEQMQQRLQMGVGICRLSGPDPTFIQSPLLPVCQ